jgi:hypothetical protein
MILGRAKPQQNRNMGASAVAILTRFPSVVVRR